MRYTIDVLTFLRALQCLLILQCDLPERAISVITSVSSIHSTQLDDDCPFCEQPISAFLPDYLEGCTCCSLRKPKGPSRDTYSFPVQELSSAEASCHALQ